MYGLQNSGFHDVTFIWAWTAIIPPSLKQQMKIGRGILESADGRAVSLLVKCCVSNFSQLSSHLNQSCYTWFLWHFMWGLAKGFQSYVPFSKFLYIHISCDIAGKAGILITISDGSSYDWSVFELGINPICSNV